MVGASAWCCIADHSFVSLTILTLQPYTSLSLFLLQLHLDVNRPNVIAHLTNLQFDAYTISSAESNNRSSHLLSHSTHPNNAQVKPSTQIVTPLHRLPTNWNSHLLSHSIHPNNAQVEPSTQIVTPLHRLPTNWNSHLLSHSTHPNNAQAICPERHPFSSPSNQLKFTQHSHSTHLNNAQIVPSTPIVTPVASPTRPASPSFVCVKIECAGAGSWGWGGLQKGLGSSWNAPDMQQQGTNKAVSHVGLTSSW
jgi:hypothetical protein